MEQFGCLVLHGFKSSSNSVNRVPVRFSLFLLSTACLIVLAIRALGATMGHM